MIEKERESSVFTTSLWLQMSSILLARLLTDVEMGRLILVVINTSGSSMCRTRAALFGHFFGCCGCCSINVRLNFCLYSRCLQKKKKDGRLPEIFNINPLLHQHRLENKGRIESGQVQCRPSKIHSFCCRYLQITWLRVILVGGPKLTM